MNFCGAYEKSPNGPEFLQAVVNRSVGHGGVVEDFGLLVQSLLDNAFGIAHLSTA